METWLKIVLATMTAIGATNIILLIRGLWLGGRWSARVENPVEIKLEMQQLSSDIKGLSKEISGLRSVFDGRYADLEQRQNEDHVRLRALEKWQAGLLVELTTYFHPKQMIDRMAKESETDRRALWDELGDAKQRCFAQHTAKRDGIV